MLNGEQVPVQRDPAIPPEGIALLLNGEFFGRGLLRALLIFPMVATPVAMGLVWVVMLDPSLGILRYLFGLVGIADPPLWPMPGCGRLWWH